MNRGGLGFRDRLGLAAIALFEGTRVGNALEALFANRYEAAQPVTPDRSYVPAFVRDARYDANSWSRWEMCRKIRYFERNTWLVQALRDEHTKWTVGPNGMPVIPDSSDSEWNSKMMESYLEWCEGPSLDSMLTMPQVHRQLAGAHHIEGEAFINFTRIKERGRPSRPAIQLIESHRCSSPGTEYSVSEDDDVVDGVQLGRDARTNKVIRPTGYWIRDDFTGSAWNFRSVADMHQVFDPERIGMYRGITPYHASLNTLHDVDDLEMFEMQRAKENAQIANVIKNNAGEIDPNTFRRDRYLGKSVQTAGSGSASDKDFDKRMEMYRRILGARTIALKTGEDIVQSGAENPSASTQWYWRYKLGQVCWAVGVPLILIFPELLEGMQGTVVRGIYDKAHLGFRAKSFIYAHAARRMYRYYANWARYNDPRCVDAPADWAKCHVLLPRAVNVDIGRNSAAMLAELAAGTTNYDDVYGAIGSTAEVGLRKKAKNISLIKRIAKEESASSGEEVQPEEIAAPLADIVQKLALAGGGPGDGEPDNDDEPAAPAPKGKGRKKEEPVEA